MIGAGVSEQAFFVALYFIAAEHMDVLRSQADVGHDRYAGRDKAMDRFGLLRAAFEFYRLSASFLQDAGAGFNRPLWAQVCQREGNIDDDKRLLDGAADHLGMINHLIERHRQRRLVSLHDHRHAIAHQQGVDSRCV